MSNSWARTLCFVLVSMLPVIAFAFLQGRIRQYLGLLEKYECDRPRCDADFDGDGIPGSLSIDYRAPAVNFDSWFVVEDSGRLLLKQPRRSHDGTVRTQAAIISGTVTRVIIYDHIRDGNPPRDLVFEYDGSSKMIQVAPQKLDLDVLAALAANDDTGTRYQWLLVQLATPLIFVYLAALAIFAWYRRRKRAATL
jgi:hypothetical protein